MIKLSIITLSSFIVSQAQIRFSLCIFSKLSFGFGCEIQKKSYKPQYRKQKWDCEISEFGHESDHVHLLISAHPAMDMSKFINNLKSVTSRMVRKEYKQEIRQKLWGKNFWTRSYCLITTGGATIDIVRRYIEKQGGNSSPPK